MLQHRASCKLRWSASKHEWLLEELQSSEDQLSTQKQRQPQQQAVMDVATQIEQLEKKATYNECRKRRAGTALYGTPQAYQRDYEKKLEN